MFDFQQHIKNECERHDKENLEKIKKVFSDIENILKDKISRSPKCGEWSTSIVKSGCIKYGYDTTYQLFKACEEYKHLTNGIIIVHNTGYNSKIPVSMPEVVNFTIKRIL